MSVTFEEAWDQVFPDRALTDDDDLVELAAEATARGLVVPHLLLRLCASLDDGERLDLSGLGGSTEQALHDALGLLDANDPDIGTFGWLRAHGNAPVGAVMFGFGGASQLVFDVQGSLGAPGSIWQLHDMSALGATELAPSLDALLHGARRA